LKTVYSINQYRNDNKPYNGIDYIVHEKGSNKLIIITMKEQYRNDNKLQNDIELKKYS
jgi:hypothetical protein